MRDRPKESSEEAYKYITLVRMTERLSHLPIAGGTLDQDWLFITMMLHVWKCDSIRRELDKSKS